MMLPRLGCVLIPQWKHGTVNQRRNWSGMAAKLVTWRPLSFAMRSLSKRMAATDAAMPRFCAHSVADLFPVGRILALNVESVVHDCGGWSGLSIVDITVCQ